MKKARVALQADGLSDVDFVNKVDTKTLSTSHVSLTKALETVKRMVLQIGPELLKDTQVKASVEGMGSV